MTIKFKTNSEFEGNYTFDNGQIMNVKVKDNEVTINVEPLYTSGYLRVSGYDDMPDPCYTISTATTENSSTDLYEDEEDELDAELNEICEEIENEEEMFLDSLDNELETEDLDRIVDHITEYDKDGSITKLIVSLLNDKDRIQKTTGAYICRMMSNLTDTMNNLKGKLQDYKS